MEKLAIPFPFPSHPAPLPERPPRLTVLAERLSRTIGLARALAQNGRTVDLTGIEDGVGLLCAQTMDLPPAQGRQMLPLLHDVLEQVNAMTGVLHAARQRPPNLL